MSNKDILALKTRLNDDKVTIAEYLKVLLLQLWDDPESFSGKRPFGNSGWVYDLYIPLIEANIVGGEIDNQGYISWVDGDQAHAVIKKLIVDLKCH